MIAKNVKCERLMVISPTLLPGLYCNSQKTKFYSMRAAADTRWPESLFMEAAPVGFVVTGGHLVGCGPVELCKACAQKLCEWPNSATIPASDLRLSPESN